jgi:hypothetical protein
MPDSGVLTPALKSPDFDIQHFAAVDTKAQQV